MSNLRQAAEQALKYLENNSPETDALVQVEPHVWEYKRSLVIQALRQALAHPDLAEVGEVGVWGNSQALAQPEQEPVVFYECNGCQHQYMDNPPSSCDCFVGNGFTKIEYYTAPPKAAEWVGLTDEEIQAERHKLDPTAGWTYDHFARAIEAKLKEKNESA